MYKLNRNVVSLSFVLLLLGPIQLTAQTDPQLPPEDEISEDEVTEREPATATVGQEIPAGSLDQETSAEIATDSPAEDNDSSISSGIESLGYEIIGGPAMGELRILRHGEEVWSLQTYMVSYEPPLQREDGLFEVVVDTRETRRSGTLYTLELGPEGVRVLSQVAGSPSGIPAPGASFPPDFE